MRTYYNFKYVKLPDFLDTILVIAAVLALLLGAMLYFR